MDLLRRLVDGREEGEAGILRTGASPPLIGGAGTLCYARRRRQSNAVWSRSRC